MDGFSRWEDFWGLTNFFLFSYPFPMTENVAASSFDFTVPQMICILWRYSNYSDRFKKYFYPPKEKGWGVKKLSSVKNGVLRIFNPIKAYPIYLKLAIRHDSNSTFDLVQDCMLTCLVYPKWLGIIFCLFDLN